MAIDRECENHVIESRCVRKGNKKALGYLRNVEQNTGDVIEGKMDKNVSCAEYDDKKCKKVFISDNRRINNTGTFTTKTTTTRENSFEGMEGMVENTIDAGDMRFNGKRQKGNERCVVLNGGGVQKHGRKLTEGGQRKKGKALKELCTAVKLLANTVAVGGLCRYNASKKHENMNSSRKKIISMRTDYPLNTNQGQDQRKSKDSSSCHKYQNNLPNTDTHGMIQHKAVHKDALVANSTHKGKPEEPRGVSRTQQLQRKVTKVAQHLAGGHSNTTSTSNNMLCIKKKKAKIKGKCINKATNKSFGKVLGKFRSPDEKERKELCKKAPVHDHKVINRINIRSKEASSDKNNNLKRSRKGAKEVNTNQYCDKYCHKKGLSADNCCVASSSKQKKRKAENVTEYRQSTGVKTLKIKSHGTDVVFQSLKKKRFEIESTNTGHSSILSSDAAFLSVRTEQEHLMTADQTRSGSGTSCVEKDYKTQKGITKETAIVDRLFDVFGNLFNSARSDQTFIETKMDQHQSQNFELKKGATANAHFQSSLTSCDSGHGKRLVKEKRLAKNKTNYNSKKNQGFCLPNQAECRTSAKHGRKRLKHIKNGNGRNVNRTKGTFDLATVFYEGISEKCNVKTGEEGCSNADDCRITCVKTKRTKQCEQSKPMRKILSVVDHLTKETSTECNSGKTTCLKGSDVDCDVNRNIIQREFKLLNEPTTSKGPRYLNNFTYAKGANLNSTDTDCQIAWLKENRREIQEKSFIDEFIEATKTAKSSFNGDGKVVNQVQISAKNNTKGTKRKIAGETVDNKAFRKALMIDGRRNNRVSEGKRRVNEISLGYGCLNMAGELDVTPDESYTKCGEDDQRLGLTSVQAVIPGVYSPSYSYQNNGNEKASEERMF